MYEWVIHSHTVIYIYTTILPYQANNFSEAFQISGPISATSHDLTEKKRFAKEGTSVGEIEQIWQEDLLMKQTTNQCCERFREATGSDLTGTSVAQLQISFPIKGVRSSEN